MNRRFKLSKISDRGRLIKVIDGLLFKILTYERGSMCEICRRRRVDAPFHILPKSTHPRLRFVPDNILLSCWYPCHYAWHADYYKARKIEEKIIELRGKNYETHLKKIEVTMPKMTMFYLKLKHYQLTKELEGLK